MNWRDRLTDWAMQKGPWTHILMAVGIAVVILAIILVAAMPSKGAVNANAADIAEAQNTIGTIANSVGTKASQAALDLFKADVTDALGDQAAGISDLDERTAIAEEKLAKARTDIAAILGQIGGALNSSLVATLTGTFGNYTLSVKSDEAGDFMAKAHLVYEPGIGNATTYTDALDSFYAGVNWSANATMPQYVVAATFNGTTWAIVEVSWNIGVFELIANTTKVLAMTCPGLNSTWEPTYVYVEVHGAWET